MSTNRKTNRVVRRAAGVALAAMALGVLGAAAHAQEATPPKAVLDRLAARATQAVDVTLDKPMLQLASAFLNADEDKDPEAAQVKEIVSKLEGVYVHHYEFANAGAYSPDDTAALVAVLRHAPWTRIMNVHQKTGDNVEVYVRYAEGGKIGGLGLLVTEPRQLTFIHIAGSIDPADLQKLSGQFGIPTLPMLPPMKTKTKPGKFAPHGAAGDGAPPAAPGAPAAPTAPTPPSAPSTPSSPSSDQNPTGAPPHGPTPVRAIKGF